MDIQERNPKHLITYRSLILLLKEMLGTGSLFVIIRTESKGKKRLKKKAGPNFESFMVILSVFIHSIITKLIIILQCYVVSQQVVSFTL